MIKEEDMAYKVLGDRIKKIRLENNMTQQEFAEALGYTHKSMINKIETGQTDISFDIVLKLIIIFKVNANEFLDLSDAESEELMIKADKADKPDWRKVHPLKSRDESVVYVKPTVIANPNIIVGEYTYFDGQNFQRHVTHHYDFIGDKLIIGKFCQIGRGVEFIMNGANHQMNSVSTYPFYIFNGWRQDPPKKEDLPYKGDTVIGNDVWIGQNVTFLPGVHVGDGCIVGANAVVGSDIPPYSVVVGNPARVIRKRFDDEMIELLENLEWWNKTTNQIQKIIPLLSNSDIAYVKEELKCILNLVQSKNGHNKIIVVGPSGAGKSYFSKQLASITGLPLYHLDNIFWKEDKTHISREEFDEKLLKILEQDKWIIDGDYSRTYELRIRYADTIYFLDFPLEVALEGVESRIGKPREDIPWKEEAFDPEFKQWIIDWYKNTQPWVYHLLEKYKDTKNIIVFKSREEIDSFLSKNKDPKRR